MQIRVGKGEKKLQIAYNYTLQPEKLRHKITIPGSSMGPLQYVKDFLL